MRPMKDSGGKQCGMRNSQCGIKGKRPMKDSGIAWIGKIPQEWEIRRIKYVLNHRDEINNPKKTDFILSLTNERGVIPYTEKGNVGNKSKEDITTYKLAYKNDIVLNSMNVFLGSVGLSNYFGCVSPVYYMLYGIDTVSCVEFYSYMFKTRELGNELHLYGKGIMDIRMRIQLSSLGDVFVPLPPLPEQQAIADKLDRVCGEIDNVITKTKAVVEEYKKLKQAIITEAVTGEKQCGMRNSQCGIKEKWAEIKLKYCFDLRDERNYLPLSEVNLISLYTDKGVVQHCDLEETTGNKASNADGYKIVKKGDIVVNIILCWMGAIGMSLYDGVTSPAYDVYKPLENIYVRYFHYLFRTSWFSGECFKVGRGIMAMRWRTYSDEFRSIKVLLPPLSEQQAIVAYLDAKCGAIDELIAKKQQLITEMENYKKSVIYEYVTGKKDVGVNEN